MEQKQPTETNVHETSKSFLNEQSASLIEGNSDSLLSQDTSLLEKSNQSISSNQNTHLFISGNILNESKQQQQTKSISASQVGTSEINSTTNLTKYKMSGKMMQNISEEYVEQVKKIVAIIKDVKPQKQNNLQLQTPKIDILLSICQYWNRRQNFTPKYRLKINIIKPQQTIQQITQIFRQLPSLIVSIDGQVIQNKDSVFIQQGDKIYEGTQDQFMKITKIKQHQNGTFQIQDFYMGEVKNRKQHGRGIFYNTPQNRQTSWTYEGQFVNGYRQGKGTLITAKTVYQGQFHNDYKHGDGIQYQKKKNKKKKKEGDPDFTNKWKYEGKFVQGNREDVNAKYECKYHTYEGPYKDNVKSGYGILKYKNGDKYQGEFQNDVFSGKGIYTYEDGGVYDGQFKQNMFDGHGVLTQKNGNKYEGQFKAGKKHGQGMYTWPDGDYYDGSWQNDLRQGTGAQTNGSIFFDGQFHLGDRHGIGQETDGDGNTIRALWQHNNIKKKIEVNGQPVDD